MAIHMSKNLYFILSNFNYEFLNQLNKIKILINEASKILKSI